MRHQSSRLRLYHATAPAAFVISTGHSKFWSLCEPVPVSDCFCKKWSGRADLNCLDGPPATGTLANTCGASAKLRRENLGALTIGSSKIARPSPTDPAKLKSKKRPALLNIKDEEEWSALEDDFRTLLLPPF
jgi:hypothetical protein